MAALAILSLVKDITLHLVIFNSVREKAHIHFRDLCMRMLLECIKSYSQLTSHLLKG